MHVFGFLVHSLHYFLVYPKVTTLQSPLQDSTWPYGPHLNDGFPAEL